MKQVELRKMMKYTDPMHQREFAVSNCLFVRLSDGAFSCTTSSMVALALVFDIKHIRKYVSTISLTTKSADDTFFIGGWISTSSTPKKIF